MKSSAKQSIPNPDNNVKNNTTISHDEYQNITHQVYYTSATSNPRYKPKIRKKTGNNCYSLNLLKTNGNINLLYNDEKSKKEYQNLMIIIFSILFVIYYYFTKDSYDDLKNINIFDTKKKKNLLYLSFIGSLLILISGVIFLIIAIVDDEIDTEIAFN